jgi:hypothetical protein
MTRKDFNFRWRWTSILAIAVFAVLASLDLKLKAETGFGTADLQKVATAHDVRVILSAWIARQHAITAGFNLGFDYLFMPLYAFAFYYGAIAAREAFAPSPGLLRRVVTLLAAVPLAGGLCDAAENAFETAMLIGQPTDLLAQIAFTATTLKFVCFYVGLLLWAAGIFGAVMRRKVQTI